MLRITAFADGDWRTVPFDWLKDHFLEICEAHRAQGRALAFAFILFDRSHPYVRSALAQEHYWDALNERSGRHLSVFSLDARPQATTPGVEQRWMYATEAPTPERLNAALSQFFEGIDSNSLPCVLFFQVAGEQVIDTACVALGQLGLETTYRELEEVIGSAADAVAKVEDDNAENAQEIFNLIKASLRERQHKQAAIRLFRTTRPIREIVGVLELFRLLLGS